MTTFSVKPIHIALTALVLGILFDVLFFRHMPGISVPIFWAAVLGTITLFDRLTHKHMNWHEIAVAGAILILSLFFAIRASEFLMVLNSFAIIYLFLWLLASLYGAPVKHFDLHDFILFPALDVWDGVAKHLPILKEIKIARSKEQRRVFVGILAAVIIGAVFIKLFASADIAVAKLIESWVSPETLKDVWQHLLVILVVTFVALLFLAPAFWKRLESRTTTGIKSHHDLGIEAAIVFAVSNVLFVGFLVIQAVYLFGGQENIARFDVTYATYAREGFFQLLVVALIVTAMVWMIRLFEKGKQHVVNQVLQTTLILQTLVVLTSSWVRLSLYEQEFGFTEMRLFSHYFLIVVAAIMVILLVSLYTKASNTRFLMSFVWVFALALIGLNILNPDAFIAQKNIARAEAGQGLDATHLIENLSDDAAPAIAAYLKEHPEFFKYWYGQTHTEEARDWQSWNWSAVNADHLRAELRATGQYDE